MPFKALPAVLDDPADSHVWRYINFEKFLSLLTEEALFFASGRILARDDKYEGQATCSEIAEADLTPSAREKLDEQFAITQSRFFFNCWHMNDEESDAMWKIYVSGIGGVAILSSISRLKQCFGKSPQEIHLGCIRYIKDETGHHDHLLRRFMRKKPAFKHEQEVRLIFVDNDKTHIDDAGLLIPVDTATLIDKIVVSPRAESWFVTLVQKVTERLGYKIEVEPSHY